MLLIRSVLFNTYLYVISALIAVSGTFTMPFHPRYARWLANRWSAWIMAGHRLISGTKVEVRGLENIPPDGALIACKHQSMWDTVAFFSLLRSPSYIMKKELGGIPFFGWMVRKVGSVLVDRDGKTKALKDLIKQSEKCLASGHSLVIFPEGTRSRPGEKGEYKSGVAALYAKLDSPCVPVALNSGVYWPRRRFLRHPGTIIIEFLPPIEPGLKTKAFMKRLEEDIENASLKLYEIARHEVKDLGTT